MIDTQPLHPQYRDDIDGLRAIAVLSVIGFHAFPLTVPGGFIGVDIFFVISGYLISKIIVDNVAQRRFDFFDFYARRTRRIFPALLLVLAATLAFGAFTLLADEFRLLGKHVGGGATFLSNFMLWQESGYFDRDADTKLLLHLWSLAIEEQFYLVWPAVVLIAWWRKVDIRIVIVVLGLSSLVLNVVAVRTDPVADFFSPQTRFWELLAGALLAALHLHGNGSASRFAGWRAELCSVLGALLLAAGLAYIRRRSPFPGYWAVLPVAGTALMIAAGPHAWLNRHVLGQRALVAIGLISYPLYLWHWPILAYARTFDPDPPARSVRIAAVAAAILLAWMTYRWVEKPIRSRKPSVRMTVVLVVLLVCTGMVGLSIVLQDGYARRDAAMRPIVNVGELGHDTYHRYSAAVFEPCLTHAIWEGTGQWNGITRCFQSKRGPATVAVIGDSHAEHLFLGLAEGLPDANVVLHSRGALPFVTAPEYATIFPHLLAERSIHTVVLAGYWGVRLPDLTPAAQAEALDGTVRALIAAGKQVVLVGDTPRFEFDPSFCKYAAGNLRSHRCSQGLEVQQREAAIYEPLFAEAKARYPQIDLVDVSAYFCTAQSCAMDRDGVLLFRDDNHLSFSGSRYLARRVLSDHPRIGAAH